MLTALLALTATAQDDDHGDTATHATALTLGVVVEGRIDPAGDVDYFSLELDAEETVLFESTGSLDTEAWLYDANELYITYADEGGEGNNFRFEETLEAGTYYLRIQEWYGSGTGDYGVSATAAVPPPPYACPWPRDFLPFVPAAGWRDGYQGFVRLHNTGATSTGRGSIAATDDEGTTYEFDISVGAGNPFTSTATISNTATRTRDSRAWTRLPWEAGGCVSTPTTWCRRRSSARGTGC